MTLIIAEAGVNHNGNDKLKQVLTLLSFKPLKRRTWSQSRQSKLTIK